MAVNAETCSLEALCLTFSHEGADLRRARVLCALSFHVLPGVAVEAAIAACWGHEHFVLLRRYVFKHDLSRPLLRCSHWTMATGCTSDFASMYSVQQSML